MAKEEIIISVSLKGAAQASDGVQKLGKDLSKLSEEELKLLKIERERVLSNRNIIAGIDQEIIATNAKANATKKARTQAGLNNAILLETGRLASDASFGFTAMANNLSQLTSLFGSFVQTNDGVVASFKQLGKSLMGTGGVLLLVQLFIAALQSKRVEEFIKSLGGLSKAMQLVKESFEKANEESGKQVGFLRTMETLVNDNTVSLKQKEVILKKINKEHSALNPKLDEEGKLTEESTKQLNAYIEVLKRKAKAQALINTIQEEYVKLEKLQQSTTSDNIGFFDVLTDKFRNVLKGQSAFAVSTDLATVGEENRAKAIQESTDLINKLTESLKQLGIPSDVLENDAKRVKKNINELKKLYEQFLKELAKARKQAEKDIAEFQENQDNIALASAKKIYAQRLLGLTMALKAEKKTEEEFATGKVELDKFLIQAEIEALQERLFNEKLTANERFAIEEELYNKRRQLLNLGTEEQKKTFEESLEYYNQLSQELFSAIGSMYDAEIQREERKTTLLNNQLQERLNNEKLTAEQREAINKQIENNEVKLAKKRDELAERQFKLNKAASISTALVNTYLAATDVLAKEKLGVVGKIAAMTLVISTGLAQVAAIARQQFVPTALPSGSAGGAGGGVEAPDFNIVGASTQSQLAQTVAGAESRPVRAFVVGKDVSTQQEMDRNITNTASFG